VALQNQLMELGVRSEADLGSDRMQAKIRKAQLLKVPYMVVMGEREVEAGVVALRKRDGTQQNNLPIAEFLELLKAKIATRSADL
jgi:threonyl-tRNA synthetase